MIEISNLNECNIGQPVVYYSGFNPDIDLGKISSWNDNLIFAKFKSQNSSACRPQDLFFLEEFNKVENYKGKVDKFEGEYGFLSNFYIDFPLRYKGIEFSSSESAYMGEKSGEHSDLLRFSELLPSEAKQEVKKVKLREDWDLVKDYIMFSIVYAKFSQNEELKNLLLETKDFYLEEGNWWGDKYWGVYRGEGKNMLGHILMLVRKKLDDK